MPAPIPRVATTEEKVPGAEQEAPQALLEESPVHSPMHSPPQWDLETLEDKEAELPFLEFDLGPLPELGPDIDHFLQEPARKSREDRESNSSPEPPAEEYKRWVQWRGQAVDMPSWWGSQK